MLSFQQKQHPQLTWVWEAARGKAHTAQHPGSEPAPKGRKKLVSPSRLPKPTPPNLPPKPVLVGIAILFHMSFYGQLRGCEVCGVVGFIFLQ